MEQKYRYTAKCLTLTNEDSPILTHLEFEVASDKVALILASPLMGDVCGASFIDRVVDMNKFITLLNKTEEELGNMVIESNLKCCSRRWYNFLFEVKNEDTGRVVFSDGIYEKVKGVFTEVPKRVQFGI